MSMLGKTFVELLNAIYGEEYASTNLALEIVHNQELRNLIMPAASMVDDYDNDIADSDRTEYRWFEPDSLDEYYC